MLEKKLLTRFDITAFPERTFMIGLGGKCGIRVTDFGVRSTEKMRSVKKIVKKSNERKKEHDKKQGTC